MLGASLIRMLLEPYAGCWIAQSSRSVLDHEQNLKNVDLSYAANLAKDTLMFSVA